MRKALIVLGVIAALVGYTKLIWQSGFDAGGDAVGCVIASLQNDGALDRASLFCRGAEAYKRNPLWALRRRGHSPSHTALDAALRQPEPRS